MNNEQIQEIEGKDAITYPDFCSSSTKEIQDSFTNTHLSIWHTITATVLIGGIMFINLSRPGVHCIRLFGNTPALFSSVRLGIRTLVAFSPFCLCIVPLISKKLQHSDIYRVHLERLLTFLACNPLFVRHQFLRELGKEAIDAPFEKI